MKYFQPGWMVVLAAMLCAGAGVADIRKTPHSLVRNSVAPDASDVCVFCHTPDISAKVPLSSALPSKPPAWQPSADLTQEFIIYDDIGRMGLGMLSVGSHSVACLSCHDGTQALSVTNTSFDHPYGVPYRGAIKGNPTLQSLFQANEMAASGLPFVAAKKLVATEDFREVSQGVIENRPAFWVSKNGISTRRTRSDLPVYARQSSEFDKPVPFIECSSCHDPHTETPLFLRTSNSGSQLCLTCHIK
ncbi:MAG: cytochrome c3 family protein [Rhodoferax sp.]|nr:cytochrome c3 family protein [Rhodoferax sp.]